jgi:hypothetical protein
MPHFAGRRVASCLALHSLHWPALLSFFFPPRTLATALLFSITAETLYKLVKDLPRRPQGLGL